MRTFPFIRLVVLLVPVALVFASCQKEISGEEVIAPKCRLDKINYFNASGAIEDSVAVVYNSSNQITRTNTAGGYYHIFNYKNSKISSIDYYATGGYLQIFDSVTYDGSGRLQSVLFYDDDQAAPELYGGYTITYNTSGRPDKIIEKGIDSTTGNVIDYYQYAFTYTSDNATRLILTELPTSLKDTTDYTYDNIPNYFQALSPDFSLLDIYLTGASGSYFGVFAALVFSKNNVTSVDGIPITYIRDAEGYLTRLSIAGQPTASYVRKCQ